MANPAGKSIRKYLAVYAHFIAINVAVARRRTGDLLSAGSLLPRILEVMGGSLVLIELGAEGATRVLCARSMRPACAGFASSR